MFLLLFLKPTFTSASFVSVNILCIKHTFFGFSMVGECLLSGECQWIYDTTSHALNQTSHADNQDLFEVYKPILLFWHNKKSRIKYVCTAVYALAS